MEDNVMEENVMEKGICNVQITVSDDENAAYICMTRPEAGTENTLESIMGLVNDLGIVHGVSTGVLKSLLEKKAYGQVVKFAQATPATDGEDGWYEFLFDTKILRRSTDTK